MLSCKEYATSLSSGELERAGMAHLKGRRVIHFVDLALDGGCDVRIAVADIDAPQSGGAVEDLAPIGTRVVHSLRGDQ